MVNFEGSTAEQIFLSAPTACRAHLWGYRVQQNLQGKATKFLTKFLQVDVINELQMESKRSEITKVFIKILNQFSDVSSPISVFLRCHFQSLGEECGKVPSTSCLTFLLCLLWLRSSLAPFLMVTSRVSQCRLVIIMITGDGARVVPSSLAQEVLCQSWPNGIL